MTDLSTVKLYSQANFENVSETQDDILYFVEDDGGGGTITEYSSGTSGYIIFPSGMCIQYGRVTATTSGAAVTLDKTYSDTNFAVLTGYNYSSRQTYATTGYILSASSIRVFSYSGSITACWMTIGQLASGQY